MSKIDIIKSKSSQNINNGAVTTIYSKARFYKQNDYAKNTPAIETIESKYGSYYIWRTYYTDNDLINAGGA